jgi:hypothetical protein
MIKNIFVEEMVNDDCEEAIKGPVDVSYFILLDRELYILIALLLQQID